MQLDTILLSSFLFKNSAIKNGNLHAGKYGMVIVVVIMKSHRNLDSKALFVYNVFYKKSIYLLISL